MKRLQYCISSPWNKDKLHLVYDFARECVVSARSNSIWNEKKKKNFCFAVDMYLQFACCAAVPGGGRNKEYALHLLHMCKGNIHVRYFHFNFFISIPFYTTICKRSHFSLFSSIQFLKSRCLKERNEESEKNSKRFFISNGIIRALKIN